MILAQFREPQQAIASTQEDEWTLVYHRGSPVAIITDRVFSQNRDRGFFEKVLRRWGYRRVGREPMMQATRYVRPWLLWALHMVGAWYLRTFWNGVNWLYEHRLIAISVDEGVAAYWHNIRPPLRRWRRWHA